MRVYKQLLAVFLVGYFFLTPISPLINYLVSAVEYDFNILEFQPPQELITQEQIELPIKIENKGTSTWFKDEISGSPVIELGYTFGTDDNFNSTVLKSDVVDLTLTPDNLTDSDQKIKITAPSTPGDYSLEILLYDKTNDTFIHAEEIQTYLIKVAAPLLPDLTSPQGNFEIVNQDNSTLTVGENDVYQTFSKDIKVKTLASDVSKEGETLSGISAYRLSQISDFADTDWIAYDGSEIYINKSLQTDINFSPITFYVQFKDSADNLSETYSKTIKFNPTAPIGSVIIDPSTSLGMTNSIKEVQDNNIEIELKAISNIPVTEYRLVIGNQSSVNAESLNGEAWQLFDEPQTSNIKLLTQSILDETENYTVYAQYKNEAGQISEIYSDSFYYKKYNIAPEITFENKEILYGGEGTLNVTIKNNGSDPAYNATVETTLPVGFNLTPNPSPVGEGEPLAVGEVVPTYVSTNTEGQQILKFQSIADLLPGESKTFPIKLKIGGEADGYKIDQDVTIPFNLKLFKRSDFNTGFETTLNHTVKLKPFIISTSTDNTPLDSTPEGAVDALIGESLDNQINIQTTPEAESISPVIVQFELENGIGYVNGSEQVILNGSPILSYVFTNINNVLQWAFSDNAQNNSLINIIFNTELLKEKETGGLLPVYVDHNESLDQTAKVDVDYQTNCVTPVSFPNSPCEPINTHFTESNTNSIYAKYFDIDKSASQANEEGMVTYTVTIKTSKFYDLYTIDLEDILPDGVEYIGNVQTITGLFSVDLVAYESDPDHRDRLQLHIQSLAADQTYSFSYDVKIKENYDGKTHNGSSELLSSDVLTSNIKLTGIWVDTDPDIVRTGDANQDNANVSIGLEDVEYVENFVITDNQTPTYTKETDVRVGDKVQAEFTINFPTETATHNFNYKLFIPVGTKISGELSIEASGIFSSDPQQYSPIQNGIALYFDNVSKGAIIKITYALEVLDDPNLKLATVIRNLIRSDYRNIDNSKIEYSNELTLNLIEPKLEVAKEKASGYFATGEIAEIKTTIKNIGTSTAYGVSIADSLPEGFQLLVVGNRLSVISNLGNEIEVIYDETTRKLRIENVDLQPEEEIIIVSELTTDNRLLFGQEIPTTVNISQYKNRGNEDPLPARIYPEEIHSFKFYAKESLLATFFTLTPSPSRRGEGEVVEIGRNKDYTLSANIEVVGGAPVYNVVSSIQLPADFSPSTFGGGQGVRVFETATYYINGNEIGTLDLVCNETECIAEIPPLSRGDEGGLTLYPNEILTLTLQLKTSTFAPLGTELPVALTAEGENKLGEVTCPADDGMNPEECGIRKDGSNETDKDYDNDDRSEITLRISKIDNIAPTGEITFYSSNNEPASSSGGQPTTNNITATNQEAVNIKYTAWDADSEVVGIRFSEDGINWMVDDGSLIPTGHDVMDEETRNLLGLEGEWNVYSSPVTRNTQLENEGLSYKYMQVVDLYGNVATISNSIDYDITPPVNANVVLSSIQNDLTNPEYTPTLTNYINFWSSELGEFRYCAQPDGGDCELDTNWSEWDTLSLGVNAINKNFPQAENNQKLNVYMQIRDQAENFYERNYSGSDSCYAGMQTTNESEVTEPRLQTSNIEPLTVICDSITYTTDIPQITINLNDGAEYTNYDLVDLGLNLTQGKGEIAKIRFTKTTLTPDPSPEGEGSMDWEEWMPYTGNTGYILPESWNDGVKVLCVQVEDQFGAHSNIACDEIIFDKTKPEGSLLINTSQSNDTSSRDVLLNIASSDPNLFDGSIGSGVKEYRLSSIGTDPVLLSDEEIADIWGEWLVIPNSSFQIPHSLGNSIGQQYVYIQFRDYAGNISSVYSDDILYNPYEGTGNIKINNNATFTNYPLVGLNLDFSINHQLPTINEIQPVLMRFVQVKGDGTTVNPAPAAPDVDNQSEYDSYLQSLEGTGTPKWTYWTEYSEDMQWDLTSPQPSPTGEGEPLAGGEAYGLYTVYVQYMFANAQKTQIYNDSIIYAPVYGIEYTSLDEVPSSLLSQDSFTLNLNAKNFGSLTWLKDGVSPVHISYTWTWKGCLLDSPLEMGGGGVASTCNYPVPANDPNFGTIRGNSAILSEDISWNEETGNFTLKVDTPVWPGEYELTIDAIHEGVTWFEDQGNFAPKFDISILQNPNKPLPLPVIHTDLPENAGTGGTGNGTQCSLDAYWTYDGTLQPAGQNAWNAPYVIYIDGIGYYFDPMATDLDEINKWKSFLFQDLEISVWYTGIGCDFIIDKSSVRIKPKTWISTWPANINPAQYNDTVYIYQGSSLTFPVLFRNSGTATWEKGSTYLQVTNMSTWTGGRNQPMIYNSVAPGAAARFEFTLSVPQTADLIQDNLCFRVWNDSVAWESSEIRCLKIQVLADLPDNPIPQTVLPEYPRPTGDQGVIIAIDGIDVYAGPSTLFPKIDKLPYGEEVIVIGIANVGGNFGQWIKIRYPADCAGNSCKEGWIPQGYVDYVADLPILQVNITPPYRQAHICTDSKEARSGPGTNYPVIATLYLNTNTTILYQWIDPETSSGQAIWYLVYTDVRTGQTGWIESTGACEGYYYPPNYGGNYDGNIQGVSGGLINGMLFTRPLDSYTITGNFGEDWVTGGGHTGTDYASGVYSSTMQMCVTNPIILFGVPVAGTPISVRVAADGIVKGVFKDQYGGIFIDVSHPNGMMSRYLHLSPLGIQVRAGQTVTRGQVIAYVGLTGLTTGCHLHFEIWKQDGNGSSRMDAETVFNSPINQKAKKIEEYENNNFAEINNKGLFEEQCGVVFRRNGGGKYKVISGGLINITAPVPRGAIYYSNIDNIPIYLNGSIYEKYIAIGGPCSPLGEPRLTGNKTIEQSTGSSTGITGNYQSFKNGFMYKSSKGIYAVYGEIKDEHQKYGGTWGPYGFPVGDQYINELGQKCQMFEYDVALCVGVKDYDKDGLNDDLENELMKKYSPIIYLSADDQYKLGNTQEYIKDTELRYIDRLSCHDDFETLIDTDPQTESNLFRTIDYTISYFDLCDLKLIDYSNRVSSEDRTDRNLQDEFFFLKITNENTIYGHSYREIYSNVRKKNFNGSESIAIDYWFFLPFNDPPDSSSGGIHEGDWEHIEIYLDLNFEPLSGNSVFYSQHDGGLLVPFAEATAYKSSVTTQNRPKVLIAKGTHATFPNIEKLRTIKYAHIFNEQFIESSNDYDSSQSVINVKLNKSFHRLLNLRWGDTRQTNFIWPDGPWTPEGLGN